MVFQCFTSSSSSRSVSESRKESSILFEMEVMDTEAEISMEI